eukprot:TRINITY_DN14027_c0_g1_i1.p1 TRINITY_DN14027_c0_g1~~TRINITY_DN14027_c0_g1_i1.p1  ORF type:complete len:125 (+),score=28.96 TRINITY_DN14027_c0_g1_i1:198-572(+)
MFHSLVSTLKQCQKAISTKSDADSRRERLEQKVDAKVTKDDNIDLYERPNDESRAINRKPTLSKVLIKTKAIPHIFYLPALINQKTLELLEEAKSPLVNRTSTEERKTEEDQQVPSQRGTNQQK